MSRDSGRYQQLDLRLKLTDRFFVERSLEEVARPAGSGTALNARIMYGVRWLNGYTVSNRTPITC